MDAGIESKPVEFLITEKMIISQKLTIGGSRYLIEKKHRSSLISLKTCSIRFFKKHKC